MTSTVVDDKQPSQSQSWVGMLLISAVGFFSLVLLRDPAKLAEMGMSGVVGMGIVGLWRWSWFMFQVLRSRFYLHVIFPRWRQRASEVPVEDLPHMCFMVPTYKEKMWVNELVYQSIVAEAKTLAHPVTVLVNSSSDEENAAIRQLLEEYDPGLKHIQLFLMTQKDGKRKAMADSLKELRNLGLPEDTIVALMDGDTELGPGTLRGCLPFFRLFPKLGALTTDEMPVVKGSYVFSEWFHLRFAQRHYQMCSMALSRKVLCLTGRFSLFHSRATFHPDFIHQLENDSLDDWLWGRFKFLSGDDKSTWYSLLRWRYEMIYVPDVIVNSLETHSGSVVQRAYSNMRRWFGNMLRSNSRAISLGPSVVGLFPWWCLVDQRISMWTSLITPGLLILSLVTGKWLFAGIIVAWVCFSRPLMLLIIFLGRPSHLKPIHFPILVATQWTSSVIKVWNQMNMAQQSWNNRGNQKITAGASGWVRHLQVTVSRFLLATQVVIFFVALLWCWFGVLTPVQDLQGWWVKRQDPTIEQMTQVVNASEYGVVSNDRRDDAQKLQALIDQLPDIGLIQVNLPIGELDLFQPIILQRSNVVIRGQDAERTILQAHFGSTQQPAFWIVQPNDQASSIKNVQLRGFTLRTAPEITSSRPSSSLDGVLFRNVSNALVRDVDLVGDGRPVVLDQTQDITLEYVTLRGATVSAASPAYQFSPASNSQ
ncbi:MAG: glycosyltransferase [Microcoleaceae cyanobacterium]